MVKKKLILSEDISKFFRQLELTKDFSAAERAQLVSLVQVDSIRAGETILEEGLCNDAFYFLFSGDAEVLKRDTASDSLYLLNTMSVGALFGEMSETTNEPISASVKAKTDCKILILPQPRLLPDGVYIKLLIASSRNVIERLRLLSEKQVQKLAEEAKREKEMLEKKMADQEQALIASKTELHSTKQHLTNLYLQQYEPDASGSFGDIVGSSSIMRNIFNLIITLAETDTTILITGESGTGKGLIAAAIHKYSHHKHEAFVSLNCAALSDELLASELFGHKKGAFTGATEDRIGRFKLAQGGSIFLDEVGDISPRMQAYLLRVLECGEYERVGESKTLVSDARIIAATNRNLMQKVAEGSFREDLYYRLNVMKIEAPPLRNRREDIPLLIEHFREHYNKQFNRQVKGFSPEASAVLIANPWRGNVRELRNVIERTMILCNESILQLKHLPGDIISTDAAGFRNEKPSLSNSLVSVDHLVEKQPKVTLDRESVLKALRKSVWNVSEAARHFAISRTHLHRLIKKYHIGRGE